jgi:predicted nuclease of predicted toxin-antitoxin system
MRILFDQGTPAPLRTFLKNHTVKTATECGLDDVNNGDLLAAAETDFDLLITTDQNLRYQQNLTNRRIAILVFTTTSWPQIRAGVDRVIEAVDGMKPGDYRELSF